ncbi:MBL fold metallo-hydrolase [Pseudovibrio sp. JE062]|uniref:MBL fold metallo-hydrolase n=1 Tax=Pseudovibrio sp. JE062 TaxID=439495 RepID=UPI000186C53F|nr:MBL fold metallo-hydrolase [Pseudovibrio sp. JE062]EEA94512.1 twin-arginine translocation pathway signal [Pseudovibrio sp. JE062]
MPHYTMTRRKVMLTLTAAAASTMLPPVSFAAELAVTNLGKLSVSTLSDGHFDLPNNWFANADADTLAAAGDPVVVGANVWLVRTAKRLVLVDTGSGDVFADSNPNVGKLEALLAAEGISKNDITDIVITHMHADHIGGLMGPDANGFSNAKIHMAEAEWTYWTDPSLAERVPDAMKPLVTIAQAIAVPIKDQVMTYQGETDLGDGLTLIPLPGHTPGHSGLRIASGGKELWIIGDAIISEVLQFKHPEITYGLDIDPQQATKTRKDLLTRLAADGIPLAATHLSYPGMGHVTQDGDGFIFKPLS